MSQVSRAARSSSPMRAEFINELLNATVTVLETMAQVSPRPGRPFIKKKRVSVGDVTGIIGMAGENGLQGTFAISFSESCILHVVSEMLMEEFTELNDEIRDAVGEITNMISGAARAKLSDMGYHFDMAIPTVIAKKAHTITQVTKAPIIVIPFETDQGGFIAEATLWRGGN